MKGSPFERDCYERSTPIESQTINLNHQLTIQFDSRIHMFQRDWFNHHFTISRSLGVPYISAPKALPAPDGPEARFPVSPTGKGERSTPSTNFGGFSGGERILSLFSKVHFVCQPPNFFGKDFDTDPIFCTSISYFSFLARVLETSTTFDLY